MNGVPVPIHMKLNRKGFGHLIDVKCKWNNNDGEDGSNNNDDTDDENDGDGDDAKDENMNDENSKGKKDFKMSNRFST